MQAAKTVTPQGPGSNGWESRHAEDKGSNSSDMQPSSDEESEASPLDNRLLFGRFGKASKDVSLLDLAKRSFTAQFRGFGVKQLFNMNTMALLSAWHTFGAWLASCILVCVAMRMLLQGYVDWLMVTLNHDQRVLTIDYYFATFLRSWFLVCFFADLVRFCFWFGRDAWRADCFEGYRRAVCMLGEGEMQGGYLYSAGWPDKALNLKYRIADTLVQVALYTSLDIVPVAIGLRRMIRGGMAESKGSLNAIAKALAVASLVHIVIFWAVWFLTDIRLKIRGFMEARQGHFRTRTSFVGAVMRDWSPFSREDPEEAGSPSDRGHQALLAEIARSASNRAKDADENDDEHSDTGKVAFNKDNDDGPSVADRLNICVAICRVFRFIMNHAFWVVLLYLGLCGLGRLKAWLVVLAVFMAVSQSGLTAAQLFGFLKWFDFRDKLPSFCVKQSHDKYLWALQEWGERCCGLAPDIQFKRRAIFAVVVALQAVLFGVIGWGEYMAWCLLLLSLFLKQLTVRSEPPWGWLIGLLEGAIMFLVTGFFVALAFLPEGRWGLVIQTLLLVLAHQCGLQRKDYAGVAGSRVVRAVTAILSTALIIILAVVLMTASQKQEEKFSMYCTPNGSRSCANYTVQYMEKTDAQSRACGSWMRWGDQGQQFSLSDFGLFAAVAYESDETIGEALQQFFPGWRIAYSHRSKEPWLGDWTTFHDFTSPDNATTVIAVRGTQSSVDVLNDIVIWMPAAVMDAFSAMGPDIVAPTAQAIADVSEKLGMLHQTYLDVLLNYTVTIMQQHPEREFFIAGHSLGGGLAKIVSLRVLSMGLQLPAITFMSPGLAATRFLVMEQRMTQMEAFIEASREQANLFTLMPENDVVSRIDRQVGIVVPINCPEGSPLTCHGIFTGLCRIFEMCGTGRVNQTLTMPCGLCSAMPCPPPV